MCEPLPDGRLAPGQVELALRCAAGDRRRILDEPLGRILSPVEEDVLDALEQLRLDVLVDRELAGVDDPHVEPRTDRVVEEGSVHRLAHCVVPAEREGEVRDAAGDERARTTLLEERDRRDELLREGRVLLDPRGDGEDVRVEDDVLGREARGARQEVVGTSEDLDLALRRLRLARLVEGHDDDGGAVSRGPSAPARGTAPRPP